MTNPASNLNINCCWTNRQGNYLHLQKARRTVRQTEVSRSVMMTETLQKNILNCVNDVPCSQFRNHMLSENIRKFGSSPDCVLSSINKTHRPGEVCLFLFSFSHLLTASTLKLSAAAFSCWLPDEKQLFTYAIDGSLRRICRVYSFQRGDILRQIRFQSSNSAVW